MLVLLCKTLSEFRVVFPLNVASFVVKTASSLSYSCITMPSILNLKKPLLCICCDIFEVELPRLYLAFLITLLASLVKTAGLPVLAWSSNSSRADHLTTHRTLLFNNFDISLTDNTKDLKMEACACKYDSFSVLSGHISEKNKMKTEEYIRKLKLRKKEGNRNTQTRHAKRFGRKILFLSVFSIAMNTLPSYLYLIYFRGLLEN